MPFFATSFDTKNSCFPDVFLRGDEGFLKRGNFIFIMADTDIDGWGSNDGVLAGVTICILNGSRFAC